MLEVLEEKIKNSKEIIEHAYGTWGPELGIACSFGKDSITITHLVKEVFGDVPLTLIFVNTGVQFKEILKFRNEISNKWKLTVVDTIPKPFKGKMAKDRHECCEHFKIEPLPRLMKGLNLKALMVGVRKDEHPSRAEEKVIKELDDGTIRVHPILDWVWSDIWRYQKRYDVPQCKLYNEGYTSLGCEPCTKPNKTGKERGGRAQDKEKVMRDLRNLNYF